MVTILVIYDEISWETDYKVYVDHKKAKRKAFQINDKNREGKSSLHAETVKKRLIK